MDISSLLSPSDDSSPGPANPSASPRPSRLPFVDTNSNSSPVHSGSGSCCGSSASTNPRHSPATSGERFIARVTPSSAPRTATPESRDEVMADSADRSMSMSDEVRDDTTEEIEVEKAEPLSEADYERIAALLEFITDRPYQYDSHVEYIALLHRGFLVHQQAAGRGEEYPLLEDLRTGRHEMLERFPLKESMWLEWIADEMSIAKGLEDRLSVLELCSKAVEEEGASVLLWKTYSKFLESQYSETRHGRKNAGLSPEDEIALKELFTMEFIIDTYKLGAQATMNIIPDSNELWDRYRDLLMQDLEVDPTPAKIDFVKNLYKTRLLVPHATISDTFSAFSTFITRYDNANYESVMVSTNKLYAAALEKYSSREIFELRLKRGADDLAEEWNTWDEYLKWEANQPKKKLNVEMACTLYERCLLRFGDQARVWEAYVYFVLEKANTSPRAISLLKRATRHCPWSGTLWAQYIIALERGYKPFEEVSDVKHKATKTGMLDLGGLEEVLKVNIAWCGFLKRRAFEHDAGEDDFDMAEMGISEAVTETGKDDPEYRLQRIHINFCTLAKKFESADYVWKELAKSHGHSYEFWLRYYYWGLANQTKDFAVGVLKAALRVENLDWPEKLLETYRNHVEDYGGVDEVEWATIRYRKILTGIQDRRSQEAAKATAYQQAQMVGLEQEQQEVKSEEPEEARASSKRRRSAVETADETQPNKKPKPEELNQNMPPVLALPSAASVAKRDRENTTVIVKHLPPNYPEVKVRQFFRECGTINGLKIITEKDGKSSTATVEFDTKEDILAAQTRDGKYVEGRPIEVQIGTGSTLYVTNFPPSADEAYIRNLFKDTGEIVDVRFPSLKYNSHRRFCYVQFVSPEQAQRATVLDGKQLGEKETLVAKISAPNQKKDRSGPVHEGRELYIRNIDFQATEKDLLDLFKRYGQIEKIRIPPGPRKGTHKGFGFIAFATKDQALASLGLNGTQLKSRMLDVSIAQANPGKQKPGNAVDATKANTPGSDHGHRTNGDNTNSASPPASGEAGSPAVSAPSFDSIKKKTLGIMNIADTVNDTKIREMFERYGPLRKVALRPDHQGAIVEFESVADAGKATLALDGCELAGKKIAIGSLPDLMKQKPEVKQTKGFATLGKKEEGKGAFFAAPSSVIRGGSGAARGQKRRVGLGFTGSIGKPKVATGGGEEAKGNSEGDALMTDGEAEKPAKSNADFKAMFLRK